MGRRKFTLEEVIQVFASYGCEYLDDFYVNHSYKHTYKCVCGKIDSIRFRHFKRGVRCKDCGYTKTGGKKRNSLNKVVQKTEALGCKFESTSYKTRHDNYKFKCNCGNAFESSYDDFLSGKRCNSCGKKARDAANRYTLLEVIEIFLKEGCEFLSDSYNYAKERYRYKCNCGRMSYIAVSNFIQGQRCGDCKKQKIGDSHRHSLLYVRQFFADRNCEFLDNEFKGVHFPHYFRCNCGNTHYVRFNDFKNGARCLECAYTGIKFNKPGYIYLLQRHSQFKVGIFNASSNRLSRHKKNGWVVLEQKYFKATIDAYDLEQKILSLLDESNIPRGRAAFREPFDGYTEAWNAADLYVESFEGLFQKLSSQKQLDWITTFG